MSINPPFTELHIPKAPSGFYEGNSLPIALISKGIMVALVIWALVFPANANSTLGSLNWRLLEGFNSFEYFAGVLYYNTRLVRPHSFGRCS